MFELESLSSDRLTVWLRLHPGAELHRGGILEVAVTEGCGVGLSADGSRSKAHAAVWIRLHRDPSSLCAVPDLALGLVLDVHVAVLGAQKVEEVHVAVA